ncbi:TPA: N-acetylmuramoyl-L-alanine amidase, partial [Escherichia coli]|nr:N-acetylmuramoyl-L-alanine amidase [Escherichia coli]
PLDEVAYHANDTVRYNSDGSIYKPLYSQIGNANYGAIGVEMCLDRNGNITEKTFQNTVKAVKELIAKYPNVTRNKIWRHYDVTGKNCPAPWVAKPSELERFKDAVFGRTSGSNSAAK